VLIEQTQAALERADRAGEPGAAKRYQVELQRLEERRRMRRAELETLPR
jgi:hypothetical protein